MSIFVMVASAIVLLMVGLTALLKPTSFRAAFYRHGKSVGATPLMGRPMTSWVERRAYIVVTRAIGVTALLMAALLVYVLAH